MKKMLVSLAMLGTFASPAWADTSTAPNCQNPTGSWLNELGSTMQIASVTGTGAITGTYISPSGTTGQTFSLSGWFYAAPPANNGLDQVTLVTFSVNWNNAAARYNSITTWSGLCRITNNVPTITALYYYSNAFAQYSWKHINVGQDIFQPIASQ
ncbi:avidin/streptavidin family protein [Burkholderia sp. ABCPW 14]|uniref:avidin/streptavidin family protein n=1 Tax=Burkholderia sp. ABCPW 14 TaxID=1637860 RepID=UPI0018D25C50|nr:avidin/streptavidin family protein [Burkholderia sp. ABCPW 14]